MEVRNCKSCGTIFNYIGGAPLCTNCQKDIEKKYEEVKQYLYDNPGSNIQRVAEDNDVSIPQIKKWVREERLEFTEGSAVGLDCENCGAPVRTGRFCQSCKDKITTRLEKIYKTQKPEVKKPTHSNENKMRFFDN